MPPADLSIYRQGYRDGRADALAELREAEDVEYDDDALDDDEFDDDDEYDDE